MAFNIYRTTTGIIIQKNEQFFNAGNIDWDEFINDDELFSKINRNISRYKPATFDLSSVLPPIKSQEVWACGVTYYRSKVGRQEESQQSGAADFYAKVYEAERPEVFFKAIASRVAGNNAPVRIRKDSTWNVPEPELTLLTTSSGNIVGYTIGNDMSSRSIEGENPLYLPQAKMYEGSTALGPCVFVTDNPLPADTKIRIDILRNNNIAFNGTVTTSEIKRTFNELVSYVYREMNFAYGCFIMTGTGIVPGHDFTLNKGDVIKITIDHIGTLVNTVE